MIEIKTVQGIQDLICPKPEQFIWWLDISHIIGAVHGFGLTCPNVVYLASDSEVGHLIRCMPEVNEAVRADMLNDEIRDCILVLYNKLEYLTDDEFTQLIKKIDPEYVIVISVNKTWIENEPDYNPPSDLVEYRDADWVRRALLKHYYEVCENLIYFYYEHDMLRNCMIFGRERIYFSDD